MRQIEMDPALLVSGIVFNVVATWHPISGTDFWIVDDMIEYQLPVQELPSRSWLCYQLLFLFLHYIFKHVLATEEPVSSGTTEKRPP
jgi:uncharacterized membrane protein SirB2